ncbi:hypothetical protein D3C72_2077600 [compost metagenome]
MVDHQATGNGPQKGARRLEFESFGPLQQADEGVLRKVRGIGGITQATAQPCSEPTVMVAVEHLYCKLGRGHERDSLDVTNDN